MILAAEDDARRVEVHSGIERLARLIGWDRIARAATDGVDADIARGVALAVVMHCLPPRQRAVLLLREILCWRSAEVADLLATSVAAVNSALQRAHRTLSRHELDSLAPPEDAAQHGLVSSYLAAFEADDVDALTALSRREAARPA